MSIIRRRTKRGAAMNVEKCDSREQSCGGADGSKASSTEDADRNADGDPNADGCPLSLLGAVSTIRPNHERTSFIVMATFLGAFAASLGVTAKSNSWRKRV